MALNPLFVAAITLLALSPTIVQSAPNVVKLEPRQIDIGFGSGSECPAVWSQVAIELRSAMANCNRAARTSIRFAFHDSGAYSSLNDEYAPASGGADGSLLLNDDEAARPPNVAMNDIRNGVLLPIYNKYSDQGVGAADFVQFAASMGIASCSGPRIRTVVGRQDTSTAPPEGNLPAPFGQNASFSTIVQLFADKGIDQRTLAVLMGAHTVSISNALAAQDIPPGSPQDSTPESWDNNYYSETQASSHPAGVFPFQSDINLAKPGSICGNAFTEFGNSYESWNNEFPDAMFRLSILGIDSDTSNNFVDCTDSIFY